MDEEGFQQASPQGKTQKSHPPSSGSRQAQASHLQPHAPITLEQPRNIGPQKSTQKIPEENPFVVVANLEMKEPIAPQEPSTMINAMEKEQDKIKPMEISIPKRRFVQDLEEDRKLKEIPVQTSNIIEV